MPFVIPAVIATAAGGIGAAIAGVAFDWVTALAVNVVIAPALPMKAQ